MFAAHQRHAAAKVLANPGRTANSAANAAPYAAADPEFWPVIEGYEYALHECRAVSPTWVQALRDAAGGAWSIVAKATAVALHLDDTALRDMGIPELFFPLLREANGAELPSLFARFDMIETADGFRVIECNAETPFFWREAQRVNGAACAYYGLNDPNAGCEAAMIDAMRAYAAALPSHVNVAVTACNVYREDFFTADYFAQLWQQALERDVAVVPVHELRAGTSGLYAADVKIDVLHRLYPLEYMATDAGGPGLAALVRSGELRMVNPPQAILAQNKLLHVLIWGLYERGEYFTAAERATIGKLFLPSYADEPRSGRWVRKPVFGREGSAIAILQDGVRIHETPGRFYATQPVLYQQFVQPPRVTYRLSTGEACDGYAIATCAIVGGVAGAAGMRIGDLVTDGWAHFQPLALT